MLLAGVALKFEPVRVTVEPTDAAAGLTEVMTGWPQAFAVAKAKQRRSVARLIDLQD